MQGDGYEWPVESRIGQQTLSKTFSEDKKTGTVFFSFIYMRSLSYFVL